MIVKDNNKEEKSNTEEGKNKMNMEIFWLINNLANKNKLWDKVMLFFSQDMIYIFAGIIALVFLLGIIKKDKEIRWAAVSTAIFTAFNLALAYFIGGLYYTDRPFVNNKVNLLYPHVRDASFPSDHATATMSIALGLSKYRKTLGIILTILSIIIGFSRIYVGHHSPFDIVGSYIIVFITNLIYNFKLRDKVNRIYNKVESIIIKRNN